MAGGVQDAEAALTEAQRQQTAAQRDIAEAHTRLEGAAAGLTEMAADAAKACLHASYTAPSCPWGAAGVVHVVCQ